MPGHESVDWRKPQGQKKADQALELPQCVATVRSVGIAMFPPTVPVKTWLRGLSIATVSGLGPPSQGRIPTSWSPWSETEREKGSFRRGGWSPLLVPTGQGWTWQVGLSAYRLNILVLQPQLPILGTDLISLFVHHLLQLLHHLPLPL